MSLLGDIAEGIEDVARVQRRNERRRRRSSRASKPNPQKFASDIGLDGSSPFKPARREQRKRTRKASKALPSRPSAKETTRAYRETFPDHHERALIEVFEAQPQRVKEQILVRARRQRSRDGDVILNHVFGGGESPFRAIGAAAKGAASLFLLPARAASEAGIPRAVASAATAATSLVPRGSGAPSAVYVPGAGAASVGAGGNQDAARALSVPLLAGMGTAEGMVRGGPRTWGETAQGGAELIAGAIGAIPSLIVRGAQDPAGTARDLARAQGEDWSRRYGPLTRGGYDEFVERIEQEGAAPELADAAAIGGSATSVVGRGLGAAARRGALGERARRIATERPELRVTPGKTVEQDVSPNLFRALGQAGEDAVRRRAQARREERELTRGLVPGEGEVVKATLRGQNRRQRFEHSALGSRSNMAFQQEMGSEVRRGAQREIARLNRHQRRVLYPVLQGMVDLDNPARAVEQLQARRSQIIAEREARGITVADPLRRTNDELRTIDYAIANAEKIFTPKLRAFVEGEAERARRLEEMDVAMRELTAEVRRLAPQAEALGIANPVAPIMARLEGSRTVRPYTGAEPDALRRAEDDLAAHRSAQRDLAAARAAYKADPNETTMRAMLAAEQLVRRTRSRARRARRLLRLHADAVRLPRLQREFVERVRRASNEAGLPEPAFFTHSPHPLDRRSDFAVGSGNRAVAAPRRSTMSLHRTGRADQRPEAYLQGVARSIKRRHNWRLVDDQFQLARVELPSVPELRRILERDDINPNALTIHDLQRVLLSQGHDLRDFAFYNPGRLRAGSLARRQADETEGPEFERAEDAAAGLPESLADASIEANNVVPERFAGTRGWFPVTRTAYDEIHASTKPSGVLGRGVGKLQAMQSRILLGTNPPWLMFQVASNALLTGFGVRGNVADVIKAQLWWRKLDDAQRMEMDQYLGQGVFEGRIPHIGAASENALINAWRAFKSTAFVRRAGQMNPLDLMFRADNAQNRFFKRAVLYSEIKRDAYRRLGRDVGQLARAQQQVVNLLRLGPRERMDAILRNPRAIEKHAQAVLDVLGDYTRFTARERRILKRGVLFYGFLRYSLRTVFYTLPVKHPIAAGITGMLANLHNEEVRELLGGDQAPWAYSRIFFERDGELKSIDLARANPATNQFIDAIQMGPRKGFARLAGLMSPLLAGIADQGYSVSSFTGRPFTGHGDPNYWSGTDADARWRIFVGDLMRTAYPYRVAERVMVGGRGTTDDSLLFAPRFVDYRTSDAQAREAKRIREAGSVPERLTRELLPFLPKPDHTRETVRRIQQRNRRRSSSPFPQMPSSGGLPSMPSFR